MQTGEYDGSQGLEASTQIASHNNACSKFSIQVDRALYQKGHKLGLKRYCTLQNAYSQGANNKKMNAAVCPKKMSKSLAKANIDGRQVYKLEMQKSELARDYDDLKTQLSIGRAEGSLTELNKIKREKTKIDRERRSIEREIDKLSTKYE